MELSVDIDDPVYAQSGGSKGKRLRCYLQKVDDAEAIRVLKAIWKYRSEFLVNADRLDPVANSEGKFLSLVARLEGQLSEPLNQSPRFASDWPAQDLLREQLLQIHSTAPHERGYAFEAFLKRCFNAAGLEARQPFRNRGEQIDGSFLLGHETYLLEAKWHANPTAAADLHIFEGKLGQKAAWARGLFVSYNGFTDAGISAFGKGKRLICLDGRDISDALKQRIPLKNVLERKVRYAAETGLPFVAVRDLFNA